MLIEFLFDLTKYNWTIHCDQNQQMMVFIKYLISSCFMVFSMRCNELHNSEYEVKSPAIADQIISVKSTSLLISPKNNQLT